MNTTWEKTWHRGETYWTAGVSLNHWGLPLHIEAVRPYTTIPTDTTPERWKNQVIVTVLCFYVGVEW